MLRITNALYGIQAVTPLLLITAEPFLKNANIFVENNRKLVPQYRDICITSLFQCLDFTHNSFGMFVHTETKTRLTSVNFSS
jgi:hypothetical protein